MSCTTQSMKTGAHISYGGARVRAGGAAGGAEAGGAGGGGGEGRLGGGKEWGRPVRQGGVGEHNVAFVAAAEGARRVGAPRPGRPDNGRQERGPQGIT